jgi:5-keto 4-deoxyuronate isomerase
MKEMREVLISSKLAIKIGTWIVAGFGISVIALIWSMITGEASILFK